MQGTLGRTGHGSQIGGAPEQQQEVPELLSKLDNAISESAMAVNDLIHRLDPLLMRAPAKETLSDASSEGPKSPIGTDLNAKISQLRALTNSVRSVTNELAI